MAEPTVFVMTEPRRARNNQTVDLKPLKKHGNLRYCFPAGMLPEFSQDAVTDSIFTALSGFDPERDFVTTLGGSMMGAVIFGAVLRDLGHNNFRFLRWDRATNPDGSRSQVTGYYVPVEIQI